MVQGRDDVQEPSANLGHWRAKTGVHHRHRPDLSNLIDIAYRARPFAHSGALGSGALRQPNWNALSTRLARFCPQFFEDLQLFVGRACEWSEQHNSTRFWYRRDPISASKMELADGSTDIVLPEVRAHINSLVSAVCPDSMRLCTFCSSTDVVTARWYQCRRRWPIQAR